MQDTRENEMRMQVTISCRHLFGVSVQGGFRIPGSCEHPWLVVLTTGVPIPEWPDDLDHETGVFVCLKKIKEDGHSIAIVSGGDVVGTLKRKRGSLLSKP